MYLFKKKKKTQNKFYNKSDQQKLSEDFYAKSKKIEYQSYCVHALFSCLELAKMKALAMDSIYRKKEKLMIPCLLHFAINSHIK